MPDEGGVGEIAQLRRAVRLLSVVVALLVAVVVIGGLVLAFRPLPVLHAKGLVIEDATGRARILLGAPTPVSADRTRKGGESAALVVLGPDGADRVIVGQSPQPQVQGHAGKRIGEAWGVVIHDPHGSERGGIAFLDSGRAAIALDYPKHDAIGMLVDDKTNSARLMLAYPPELNAPETAAELSAAANGAQFEMHDRTGHRTTARK